MVSYFFHTEDGLSLLDTEGTEFASATEAKIEAVRMIGDMLRSEPAEFWDTRALRVIVTDEAGLILFVLDCSAVEAPALRGYGKA